MGKYEPLARYLSARPDDSWEADLETIERVLGFPLPPSAYNHQAWWANQTSGSHSHARGWQDAGWETRNVNLRERRVRFERSRNNRRSGVGAKGTATDELWRRAVEISGIEDRETLLRAALTTFVQREAARQLAALGGTMPDLKVPSRERPSA